MGRLGNSLSRRLLALSTSPQEAQAPQEAQVDGSVREIWDVSLQPFVYETREVGRLLVTLVRWCRTTPEQVLSRLEGFHSFFHVSLVNRKKFVVMLADSLQTSTAVETHGHLSRFV